MHISTVSGPGGGGVIWNLTYVGFQVYPPPCDIFGGNMHISYSMAPSEPKTGPYDPKSYSRIVSAWLKPFSAILDFFDFYHALTTLCKLKNLEELAFLAIFGNFWCKLVILAISKFGRKTAENGPILVQKSIFWTF